MSEKQKTTISICGKEVECVHPSTVEEYDAIDGEGACLLDANRTSLVRRKKLIDKLALEMIRENVADLEPSPTETTEEFANRAVQSGAISETDLVGLLTEAVRVARSKPIPRRTRGGPKKADVKYARLILRNPKLAAAFQRDFCVKFGNDQEENEAIVAREIAKQDDPEEQVDS